MAFGLVCIRQRWTLILPGCGDICDARDGEKADSNPSIHMVRVHSLLRAPDREIGYRPCFFDCTGVRTASSGRWPAHSSVSVDQSRAPLPFGFSLMAKAQYISPIAWHITSRDSHDESNSSKNRTSAMPSRYRWKRTHTGESAVLLWDSKVLSQRAENRYPLFSTFPFLSGTFLLYGDFGYHPDVYGNSPVFEAFVSHKYI